MRIGTATDDSASNVLSLYLSQSLPYFCTRFLFLTSVSLSHVCVCWFLCACIVFPFISCVDISPSVECLNSPPLEGFIYLLKAFLIFRHWQRRLFQYLFENILRHWKDVSRCVVHTYNGDNDNAFIFDMSNVHIKWNRKLIGFLLCNGWCDVWCLCVLCALNVDFVCVSVSQKK